MTGGVRRYPSCVLLSSKAIPLLSKNGSGGESPCGRRGRVQGTHPRSCNSEHSVGPPVGGIPDKPSAGSATK
jgi:hypothetical protein